VFHPEYGMQVECGDGAGRRGGEAGMKKPPGGGLFPITTGRVRVAACP